MTVLLELVRSGLGSPSAIVGFILCGLVLYIVLAIVYRTTLHPLAGYPGPFLAKITDLYHAYHAWKGDRHLEFHRCHDKYGPVVRLGPNLLSFNTHSALKQIYGFKSNVRKADFYTAFPANKNTYNIHSAIDKHQHARKRRVISYAFSDSSIKSMDKYVLSNINTACSLIEKDIQIAQRTIQFMQTSNEQSRWSEPRNMANWADWLAFDIMGDLVFGKAFGMLESPQRRFAVDLVSSAAHRHLICGTHLTIHNWHLDKIFFRHIATKRERFMKYSKAQAMERTKLGTEQCDRKDFFYYLLNAKDQENGRGFSNDELWGESNLFVIAGSDTTSTALAATFFYLTHNPTALEKVTAEVRHAFDTADAVVAGQSLTGCTYLRACIDEAMRLSPPVPGGLPRAVLPGGIVIDGLSIPAGIDVCVPHYAIHHNEQYFPLPFHFVPERWIAAQAPVEMTERIHEALSAFCPFSVGPRGCIGKGLAYVELATTLAKVLFSYDMRLAVGSNYGEGHVTFEAGRQGIDEYQLKDSFTSIKDGPMVEFKMRT